MAQKRLLELVESFTYDVSGAEHAGTVAASPYTLGTVPAGAIITHAWIDVDTTFVSAGDAATIALGYTDSTSAFDAAIAISDGTNPWDAAAPRISDTNGTTVREVSSTVKQSVLATVAVETITAGKLTLYVKYFVSV